MMKIVPQRRTTDLELSLIRSVPALKPDTGSELQHILEIQCSRLYNFFFLDKNATGGPCG